MKNILIGEGVNLDVAKLIESRLLIQANSGGGKSHTVRRLLEQTHGQVQQIVLDPEGEFSTLREKLDYVLVGKGGDLPADPRSAALLAAKLLETGVSAVIDRYELHTQDRKRFVRLFLEAMVNADKSLWHPCLVVVDEAHVFAPEHGEAESSGPVIDLCTRGRKRGFCAVLATQRLSKLHKDAAAECNNKLIGRTGLDIDMKRAADELGFGRDRILELRRLDPGEFFAYGPAISREVVRVDVAGVETSHPKIGVATKVASPTAAIRSVLAKLGDLPKEAEAEAKTIEQLKRDLAEAKRHRCPTTNIEPFQLKTMVDIEVQKHILAFKSVENGYKGVIKNQVKFIEDLHRQVTRIADVCHQVANTRDPSTDPGIAYAPEKMVTDKPFPKAAMSELSKPGKIFLASEHPTFRIDGPPVFRKPLAGAALKMAEVLVAYYPEALTVSRLCALAGYKPKVSTTRNALSILRIGDYLDEQGGHYAASKTLKFILPAPTPMTSEEKMRKWRKELGGASLAIFNQLIERWQHTSSSSMETASVAHNIGVDMTKSTWRNALSTLRVRGLLVEEGDRMSLTQELFV